MEKNKLGPLVLFKYLLTVLDGPNAFYHSIGLFVSLTFILQGKDINASNKAWTQISFVQCHRLHVSHFSDWMWGHRPLVYILICLPVAMPW